MGRSWLFLVIGAAAGAAATYYLVAGPSSAGPIAKNDSARPAAIAPAAQRASAPGSALGTGADHRDSMAAVTAPLTDGGALLRALMTQTDASVIESMVREAAAASGPGARAAMEVLLVRYGEVDPTAAMHLATELSADLRIVIPIYQSLARSDPESALRNVGVWAERLQSGFESIPVPTSQLLLQSALQELARQDPVRAVAYVDSLPAGPERQQLLGIVARGYGRSDPEAALAWAQGGHGADSNLLYSVLGGIAELDARRAVDAALTLVSPMQRESALQMVVMQSVMQNRSDPERLANLLVESGAVGRSAVQSVMSQWAGRDADAAMRWLLANEDRVDANIFRIAGNAAARANPEAAAAYLHRIPEALRSEWIGLVAQGYAVHDPQQAMRWLDPHRGDPGYGRAVANVAQFLAARDPAAAAALLEGIDENVGAGAILTVASQWAQVDPRAAASWALQQGSNQSAAALSSVVRAWATHDLDGARTWSMSLANAADRDQALQAVVHSMASVETPDARLLGAFNNDAVRQQAVLNSVPAVAQRSPEEARALIDAYLTDPAMRDMGERALSGGPPPSFSRPGVFFDAGTGALGPPVVIRSERGR
jgi:hypothetical protein